MVLFKGKKKEDSLPSGLPDNMELIVHLKLLTVFALHEAEIRDRAKAGLFDIKEIILDENTGKLLRLSKGQKHGDLHWQVYNVRAQERFHLWWKYLVLKYGEDQYEELILLDKGAKPIDDFLLPPIDILMTWHAYMLNPRNYLTDCIRAKLSRLWCTPFPWKLLDGLISGNFQYQASKDHIAEWEIKTSIPWLNEDSENFTSRKCRFCREDMMIQISKPITFRCDSWLKKSEKADSNQIVTSGSENAFSTAKRDPASSKIDGPKGGSMVEDTNAEKKASISDVDCSGSEANFIGSGEKSVEEEPVTTSDDEFSEDDKTLFEESLEEIPEERQEPEKKLTKKVTGKVGVFCDKQAIFICPSCQKPNSHADLALGRFIRDIENISNKVPLLGTTLRIVGTPAVQVDTLKFFETALSSLRELEFSNTSEKVLRENVMKALMISRDDMGWAIDNVAGKSKFLLNQAFVEDAVDRRRLINRVLCYYLDNLNSSDLSLCLYQAVVRQGSFTNKMNDSAWLRSPKINDILYQCLLKYSRFITLIANQTRSNKKYVCVPTLDVDLAWHTHQLSPKQYYTYSIDKTNTFIDHDDKISDIILDSSFENTAKRYFKRYNERYTMCYCSYCLQMQFHSVVQLSTAKLILGKKHTKRPDAFTGELSHVSAHNVVFLPSYKSLKSRYPSSATFNRTPQNSYEASNYPYVPYYFSQIYGFTPSCDSSGIVDPDNTKNCAACVGYGKNTCGTGLMGGCVNDATFLRMGIRPNGAPYYQGTGTAVVATGGDSGSSGNNISDNGASSSNCGSTSNCAAASSSACGSSCGSSCGGGGGGCGGGN